MNWQQTIRQYTPHILFVLVLLLSLSLYVVTERSAYQLTEKEQLTKILTIAYCGRVQQLPPGTTIPTPTIDYNSDAVTIDCGKIKIIITPHTTFPTLDYNANTAI